MRAGKPLGVELAEFIVRLTHDALPPRLVEKAKTYFLDWLGSVLAGSQQIPAKVASGLARSMGGNPESSILADNAKTSCLMAAFVNGVASHVMEMDDLHRESVFHPAAVVMPAAFAVAQRQRASGREFLLGVVAGYETGIRVALAVGSSHYRYWHTTATCGTFGAAAGAGKILGLNTEQMAWALGSAGTQAAGLWEFLAEGAMSKQLHAGKAAMSGVMAALLAKESFTGAERILEGEKGFFRATSVDFDDGRLLDRLAEEFVTERNSLKYHASCGHTHSIIDATLKALEGRPLKLDAIESIRVTTYQAALDLLQDVQPITPYAAKFSIPFCVATAVKHRSVGLSEFSEARLDDPQIQSLMERVELRSDPKMSAEYPRKWTARVEILTRDGERLEAFNEYPKGDPENPLSEEECKEKFKALARAIQSEERSERIAEQILRLEELGDINELELS